MSNPSPRIRIALLLATLALLVAPAAQADLVVPDHTKPDLAEEILAELTPAPVAAAPTPETPLVQERTGQEGADVRVSGTTSRTVWAGGRNVEIASTSADALAAGESVNLVGQVLDNFMGAGRLVQVSGPVGGDVFLAGETVEVRDDVQGDVYALAETVRVPDGVRIGGNLYFGGAVLDLDGEVGGDLVGGGADLMIDGTVHGDVRVDAANLHVGPSAHIGGDLVYESIDPSSAIEGAVGGDVSWSAPENTVELDTEGGAGAWIGWRLFLLFGAMIAGIALLLLFPSVLAQPGAILEKEWPVSLGVGFAVLIGVPVMALFLAVFILPIPLSALALAIWLPATYIARLVVAFAVGKVVLERGREDKVAKPLGALAVGTLILHVVYAIPYLGGLLMMVATVFGLGALFLAARRATRSEAAVA